MAVQVLSLLKRTRSFHEQKLEVNEAANWFLNGHHDGDSITWRYGKILALRFKRRSDADKMRCKKYRVKNHTKFKAALKKHYYANRERILAVQRVRRKIERAIKQTEKCK